MEQRALLTPEDSVIGAGTVEVPFGLELTWQEYLVKLEFRMLRLMEAEKPEEARRLLAVWLRDVGEHDLALAVEVEKFQALPELVLWSSETLRANLGTPWEGVKTASEAATRMELRQFREKPLEEWLEVALGGLGD